MLDIKQEQSRLVNLVGRQSYRGPAVVCDRRVVGLDKDSSISTGMDQTRGFCCGPIDVANKAVRRIRIREKREAVKEGLSLVGVLQTP